ncbi:sodium-coupled monocarboxylate transporter 2 isoform X1 [Folsomia candida]|uniref:sodium-coupled monocarboxylate transporter 2 isoform X1 n=1 Tax=Folsomia candida TaxID=158441 RepID=UPI001604D348|nr:sodium-coupled monocarboxylate transporter 2 isoform X1 [Folsomia candida]XP_035707107.1 sodium-coupled monocarboxylate transporter 2 isoform X1 [Folsomia candida]
MSIAVYAPSLAIELVTGVSTRISTAVISFVCIFYSTLGGLKAVLWADVLQAFIMLLSLAVIAGKGVADVGGMTVMWDRVQKSGRVHFFNFDPDPRTRHTVWTCLIAGYFFWLPTYAATQVQIQRFLSLPTISRARRTIVINFVGLFVIVGLCFFTGCVILAKYYDCDPLTTKEVEKSDQLVPHFVKSTVEGVPGLLGLFVSGLTCASMSSLSSGLSALSSITTYDYVSKWFPHFGDAKLSQISKLSCFVLGVVTYLFIFVVEIMGNILPATTALSGLLIGPTLGLFTLGMFFPPTTTKKVNPKCISPPLLILWRRMWPEFMGRVLDDTEFKKSLSK